MAIHGDGLDAAGRHLRRLRDLRVLRGSVLAVTVLFSSRIRLR